MGSVVTHRIVLLRRGTASAGWSTSCYIPERLAVAGTLVQFRERGGGWSPPWEVASAWGDPIPAGSAPTLPTGDVRAAWPDTPA
jgi:hypothetical protein